MAGDCDIGEVRREAKVFAKNGEMNLK